MEKVGLISAVLRTALARVPDMLLTPAMVFLGIMSSLGSDAGYVVLPPLAALAYLACGRSPLAGIAAVFAGVSAGFNANLLITSLEPLMSNLSQAAAQTIDPAREVAATSAWYFMIASTFVLTFAGWATTAVFVEKRLSRKAPEDGGPVAVVERASQGPLLTPAERKGLLWAGLVFAVGLALTVLMVFWEGSPLYGIDGPFPRWVAVIVPLMFVLTILPAMAYGVAVGVVKSTKDATRTMIDSMAAMAPIIVLAFFAGQFVSAFEESGLGRMLAFSGGEWLFEQRFPAAGLVISFIFVTMIFNLFIGSMSAKYALFAPIFVPMFMLIGIRPELTQTAYRIGDSTTNIITPLNAYLIIVLMYVQKYAPKAGIGTLIAMMLPYTVVFTAVWIVMILLWEMFGLPLGPGDLGTPFSEAYMESHAGG
jgi:aminobenzoyl-glutamate transport protein